MSSGNIGYPFLSIPIFLVPSPSLIVELYFVTLSYILALIASLYILSSSVISLGGL